jgi:hypothetical protein
MSGKKSLTFSSALAVEAVREVLLRSVSTQPVPPYLEPWFYRMYRNDYQTRPVWGVVETHRFRLRRSSAGAYAPNLYATWEPQSGGTRIEGYFDLGPIERLSLRITVVVMLAMSVVGILLNTLDLTRGTHFTNDPQIGLVLSVLFAPFCLGFYLFIHGRGSRADDCLLAFIETTLAARRLDNR